MTARGHGLNADEALVLELWDSGCSVETIAERTGKGQASVFDILGRFNTAIDRRREAAVRSGCARYAVALADAGKVYA